MLRPIDKADRKRPTGLLGRLCRDRSGNTLALVAGAMMPMLAMVGSAIDLGRSYLSESRLQQACDAGVLAARKRLGSAAIVSGVIPTAVADTGNRFFDLNFSEGSYGTDSLTFDMTLEDDYAISGHATVNVPTAVMKIFGTENIPLQVDCEAQLNFSNTDVMMVLDTTGSMRQINPGDTESRIEVLRATVKNFYTQLETAKAAGTRIRYGFVPYSTNVNVGALLADDWVVDDWHYQSRENHNSTTTPDSYTYTDNWVHISGTETSTIESTYPATYHAAVWHPPASEAESGWWEGAYYSCDTAAPASSSTSVYTELSKVKEDYAGPPAGKKETRHMRRVLNGPYYWIDRSGTTCQVHRTDWSNYTHEYDEITIPIESTKQYYRYDQIDKDVRNWRSDASGCMEERSTYEIDDYGAVDFTRALDLDIDTVPTAGNPDTQWRPMYPGIIFERELNWWGSGDFKKAPTITDDAWAFYMPINNEAASACPQPARKLAEMTSADMDTFLASLQPKGFTYHDIGMIWGGRLISPNGLFADENVDIDGKKTSRHLIFLTDGETHPEEIAYSSYGVEPLDERRWDPKNPVGGLTLTQVVESRFAVACEEVKKRNITVWVIGFGTDMTDLMKQCAGEGRWFQADNSGELTDVFNTIAKAMGELRVSK